jgi:hypothetical protein
MLAAGLLAAEPGTASVQAPAQTLAAEPTPAADANSQAPAAFDCAARKWVLDGAPAKADAGDGATFSPAWQATLEGIASCSQRPAWKTACVAVQGHTDAIAFNDPVVAAFGSVEAAQLARGRGRSATVLNRLYQLGVPSERLRELPPSATPDFRGVTVSVVPGCAQLGGDGQGALTHDELRSAVRDSVSDALEAQRRAELAAQPKPVVYPHTFWLEANLSASLVGTTPDSAVGPLLDLGGGWRWRMLYAHADVGFAVGSTAPQRLGFEFGGGAGWYHARWLQVGLLANDRFSSSSVGRGWLEQTWALGVEGTHCLMRWRGYDLCAREAVLPLGGRTRRAEEIDGTLYRIPDAHDSSLRFELGVSLRRDF